MEILKNVLRQGRLKKKVRLKSILKAFQIKTPGSDYPSTPEAWRNVRHVQGYTANNFTLCMAVAYLLEKNCCDVSLGASNAFKSAVSVLENCTPLSKEEIGIRRGYTTSPEENEVPAVSSVPIADMAEVVNVGEATGGAAQRAQQ